LFSVDVSGLAGGFSQDYPHPETIGFIESGLGRSRRWGQKPRNLGWKEGVFPERVHETDGGLGYDRLTIPGERRIADESSEKSPATEKNRPCAPLPETHE